MAIIHAGQSFSYLFAIIRFTEFAESLLSIGVSSELAESTVINTILSIDSTEQEVYLPISLAEDIYTFYNYNEATLSWSRVTNYSRAVNRFKFKGRHTGILLAFPFDAFRATYYNNGPNIYEMYMARLDARVYRNIDISTSQYLQSPYINIQFSFNIGGPWSGLINSANLCSIFYMKIDISNIDLLPITQVIPSEFITLTCLVCE